MTEESNWYDLDWKGGGDDETNDDEYEREWEDLDEKVILAQILTELTQIRVLLSDGVDSARDNSSSAESYECVKCDTVVPAGGRERHASKEHNAPPGMADALFEVVE